MAIDAAGVALGFSAFRLVTEVVARLLAVLDLLAGLRTLLLPDFFADFLAPFLADFLDDFRVTARFTRTRETFPRFRFFVCFLTVLLRDFATTNSFSRSNKIVGILAS